MQCPIPTKTCSTKSNHPTIPVLSSERKAIPLKADRPIKSKLWLKPRKQKVHPKGKSPSLKITSKSNEAIVNRFSRAALEESNDHSSCSTPKSSSYVLPAIPNLTMSPPCLELFEEHRGDRAPTFLSLKPKLAAISLMRFGWETSTRTLINPYWH